ncbi:MAG TPA: uroporphyrinogen decarboxylase family protein [bacterium]|nr:uroporphyrinogen decarboxylase family protein [bacterium]HOL66614.1 uroporphyrinogen decarboxylase family protein [bacterium]
MTQLEIFRATCNHQKHSSFLYHAGFTPELWRRLRVRYGTEDQAVITARMGLFEPVTVNPVAPPHQPDFSIYFQDVEKPEGSFINGCGVLEIPARYYHFTGYISPLRQAQSLSEIENFPFPPETGYDETGLKEKVEQAHREGKVACTAVGHIYETSWQIRGYEQFLMDLVERPAWSECILDRIAASRMALATAGARAGVDYLITGDDVANQKSLMFSLPMWRRFIKSRWAKIYQAARSLKPDIQIWYHSDGNIEAIIPELIDIGVTILNPLQPECLDVPSLKARYGRHLVFDGTIGTQSTMPFGTPEEVARVVRENKKVLGYDGALILAPTHVLEPEVPLENIEAFIQACRE